MMMCVAGRATKGDPHGVHWGSYQSNHSLRAWARRGCRSGPWLDDVPALGIQWTDRPIGPEWRSPVNWRDFADSRGIGSQWEFTQSSEARSRAREPKRRGARWVSRRRPSNSSWPNAARGDGTLDGTREEPPETRAGPGCGVLLVRRAT